MVTIHFNLYGKKHCELSLRLLIFYLVQKYCVLNEVGEYLMTGFSLIGKLSMSTSIRKAKKLMSRSFLKNVLQKHFSLLTVQLHVYVAFGCLV